MGTSEPTGEFAGVRALVTGGASGIGLAVADFLADRGAAVAVLDRDVSALAALSAREPAGRHTAVEADITQDPSVRAAVALAVEALGGLEVVVNCAGIGAQGDVSANTDEEWRRVLDVNVVGIARVTRAALPALRAAASAGRSAAIVNVGSIAATAGLPNRAVYSASKGAVLSLTLAMAADLLPDGVRVNAVNPGTADTPWVARLLDAADDPVAERAALAARQPHGRLVTPQEIAHAVAYLASPLAGSTTGTTLAVDGGMDRLRPRR
jgi:NAD(P)-dependent dehydrogenase (short-subunit alcohol dehydrogenase family)